ncbi:MAG: alpha/beta hydrolase, partial [Rhizobiaceae bacterium]|nr:alpha/beta hydrolase [Rhizobiaceae bacterium]
MKTYWLDVNGASLNILEDGEGDIALVFLHYWGGSSKTARDVIEQLSPSFRCIAFDQRGWGGSAKTGDFTLDAYAADTAALIAKLGLRRYVLVGHSMGGKIAQLLAATRPDGLVGLVLIAPAPPVPVLVPEEQREMMLESYQAREGVGMALTILTER